MKYIAESHSGKMDCPICEEKADIFKDPQPNHTVSVTEVCQCGYERCYSEDISQKEE